MKKTIICFGDSNTHGYDTANDGRFDVSVRYPGRLAALLGDAYDVKEEGLSGRTCCFDDPLFEGLNGLRAISPVLLTHEPVDLLIIMLGTNDVKARFSATAPNIAKGMERLLQKAIDTHTAWRSCPHILLVCPPPIAPGYAQAVFAEEMGAGCAEKSTALAAYYQQTAERLGCHFLDAGSIPGIQMHPRDCMHLSAESHTLLAKRLAALVPELTA